jgi:hypothetical protein
VDALIAVEAGVSSLFNVEQTDSQKLPSMALDRGCLTAAVFMSDDFQSHSHAESKEEAMKYSRACATGLGAGAALMFLLDPDRGRRRRAWIRNKCVRIGKKTERAMQTTSRDVRNRLQGLSGRFGHWSKSVKRLTKSCHFAS